MKTASVIERVQQIAEVRADVHADRGGVEAGLRDVAAVRAWCDASEADLIGRLTERVSFPEAAITDATHSSNADAGKAIDRSKTLGGAPDLASALEEGRVTAGHIDAVTKAAGTVDAAQRDEVISRCDELADVAAVATVDDWRRRVRDVVRDVQRGAGIERLERQRRATTLSTWVDNEGMWNLRGRFDPLTGVALAARLDSTVDALFSETAPETSPSDPVVKQAHLRALALARLIEGLCAGGRSGRPEYVVVIDAAGDPTETGTGSDEGHRRESAVTWPIPVEIPRRVLHQLMSDHADDVHTVIVRNGVVLHAPGALNLGRTTRLASRAQRRALRGLYSTCAIPGCRVSYDRCKLHHVIWWRHGGRTDLDNLVPVCSLHHSKIHHDGWTISLGPNRELTTTCPDGTTMTTGPPRRHAA